MNNLPPLVRCARTAAAGARGWTGEPLRPDDFGIVWKHLAWKIARRISPTRSDSPRLYDRADFGGEIVPFRRSK